MAAADGHDPLARALGEFLAAEGVASTKPALPAAPQRPAPVRPAPRRPNLTEAFDEVVADEARKAKERAVSRSARGKTIALWLMLVALVGASGYVWFGKPAFLAVRIEPVAQPSTPIASRRSLLSIALLIDDFRITSGRLPTSLAELGVALPNVGYIPHRTGEFELRLGSGVHALVLRGGTGHNEPEMD